MVRNTRTSPRMNDMNSEKAEPSLFSVLADEQEPPVLNICLLFFSVLSDEQEPPVLRLFNRRRGSRADCRPLCQPVSV